MKLKNLLSLALVFVMSFSAFGCQALTGSKPVAIEDLEIPTYKDEKEMILRVDLPPNMSSREQMELYKECGFNAIPLTEDFFSAKDIAPYMEELAKYKEALALWESGDKNEETKPVEPEKPAYIRALEICEELDIDVYIRPHHNPWVSHDPAKVINDKNYFEEYFYNMDFRDYPAIKGIMIVDEPTWGQVTDLINRYLPWFNENYGGDRDGDGENDYEMFANLLAAGNSIWKDKDSQTKTYEDFITRYYNEFLGAAQSTRKTISFDTYVLNNDGTNNYVSNTFLSNNVAMRGYADRFGTGFGAYIQCFTGYSTLRDPASFADFAFQVYTYLAFGADRLSFYGYRDYPPESHLMEGGVPRQKWYWVQEINTIIKKLDGLLGNFDYEGIYTNVGTGSFFEVNEAFDSIKSSALKKLNGIKSVKSKYDAIVTQLKDANNRNGFMLVNYEEPSINHNNKVSMEFENADGIMYYRDGEPIIESLENKTFNIDLKPGEGVFIIPLYKK
ncbi:MAG: hypothetical protein E7348_04360 [Clostridiales bacterium]|nr:hypothetical protein [Clostridiales bacterium]